MSGEKQIHTEREELGSEDRDEEHPDSGFNRYQQLRSFEKGNNERETEKEKETEQLIERVGQGER